MRKIGLAVCVLVALCAGLFLAYGRSDFASPPELPGELRHSSLEVGGHERSFQYYVPSIRAAKPALIFVLHGSGGDGASSRGMTAYGFDELAEVHGLIPVYPDGYERHWNDCRGAGPYAANDLDIDDPAFFDSMIVYFERTLGIDRDRVYATGLSNGGQMAYRLALELPERIAAVAPVAASLPDAANLDCEKSGKPVPMMIINGTDDPMNPYEGGEVAFYGIWGNRGTVMSSQDTAAYFAGLAGPRADPTVRDLGDGDPGDGSTVRVHGWQDGVGAEVMLYQIIGGGHTWPDPAHRYPGILGETNHDIDGAEEVWRFVSRQRRS